LDYSLFLFYPLLLGWDGDFLPGPSVFVGMVVVVCFPRENEEKKVLW
jgi:hypothetical protein